MRTFVVVSLIFLLVLFCGCRTLRNAREVKTLSLINVYELPHRMMLDSMVVGGLSGIDYDAGNKLYFLISDDPAERSPVRMYETRIDISDTGIANIRFTKIVTLFNKEQARFDNKKLSRGYVPDPEAVRKFPDSNLLVWTSEGERILRNDIVKLHPPTIFISNRSGHFTDSFYLPPNLKMYPEQRGSRHNSSLEGISFSPDGKFLYASMEEPLYEDGPRAGLGDSTALVRIIKFDVRNKQAVAQYAYPIDAVVVRSRPEEAFKINGVTDILMINEHQMIVTERSFSTGNTGSNIRLYIADLKNATPVTEAPLPNQKITPIQKQLLLDMDQLGVFVDNVEGATWGPKLSNGKQSLILVTDDNFSPTQKTQFFLFQVN